MIRPIVSAAVHDGLLVFGWPAMILALYAVHLVETRLAALRKTKERRP